MPTPMTREELYEYRIGRIVREFLKDWEEKPENGEALEVFIRAHSQDFGARVLEDMTTRKDADDWLTDAVAPNV